VIVAWRLTEALRSTFHDLTAAAATPERLGAAKRPAPGVAVAVADPADGRRRLPAGEAGEVLVRGPHVAPGYWRRPDDTAAAFVATDMVRPLSPDLRRRYLDLIPLGRFGEREEVAKVVAFLLSGEASYLHGQTVVVDGGMIH
jgi:acyl-CoA synthetase (AMP-forming)/AMP-acid ligase II